MRESTLLTVPVVLVAGCGFGAPAGEVIEDFRERSEPLACERVDLGAELAITQLRATTDTSWAILDEAQRVVRGFDDGMRPLWTVELKREGPLGLTSPVAIGVAGDTLVHVVDRGGFSLVSVDPRTGAGRLRRLEFLPTDVVALPDDGLAVVSLPMGARPRELLFLVDGDTLRPLDVPQRSYPDMSINGLGNMVLAEADTAGSILVVHQYMEPRAFRVAADGTVRALRPPVPEGTAHKRSYVPTPPVTPETLPHLYVGAAALAVDRGTGESYILVQSGHREADRSERAVVRTDPTLRYLGSYLIDMDVNAGHLAYLARRRALVLADDLDRVHLCPLPDAAGSLASTE